MARSLRWAGWTFSANRALDRAPLDPRVRYPSYKSFDRFIDVERLKSLDGYLRGKLEAAALAAKGEAFDTGVFKRRPWNRSRPGSMVIHLSESKRPFRYHDLRDPDLWQPGEHAKEFAPLMAFIETLPFKRRSRMLIMFDHGGRDVTAHRDHCQFEICHEFIWFRSNLDKHFFMLDHRTGRKQRVDSYSAWFDTVNQYHGSRGTPGLAFSIRVDGIFSDELRARTPVPACNPASTPSLWATLEP